MNNLLLEETHNVVKEFKRDIKKSKSPVREQLEFDYNHRQNTAFLDLYFEIVTAQSYGPMMEKLYIKENSYTKVPSTADRGDYAMPNGGYEEYKFTFPNSENGYKYNFVQIRPWQDLVGYLFEVYSDTDGWFRFNIPKEAMNDILHRHGNLAHGTKETNTNEKKELALRGKIGDNMWKEFLTFSV